MVLTNEGVIDLFVRGKEGHSYGGNGSFRSYGDILYHWGEIECISVGRRLIRNSEHKSVSWSSCAYFRHAVWIPLHSISRHFNIPLSKMLPESIKIVNNHAA